MLMSCYLWEVILLLYGPLLKPAWFVQINRTMLVYSAGRRVCVLLLMPGTWLCTASSYLTWNL